MTREKYQRPAENTRNPRSKPATHEQYPRLANKTRDSRPTTIKLSHCDTIERLCEIYFCSYTTKHLVSVPFRKWLVLFFPRVRFLRKLFLSQADMYILCLLAYLVIASTVFLWLRQGPRNGVAGWAKAPPIFFFATNT